MTTMNTLTQVNVPEGESGDWKVEHFDVSESQAALFNIRSRGRCISAGRYTRLKSKKHFDPVMSDTPAELKDHWGFIHQATGTVLINGLGLGVCLQACLRKSEVHHITVIEIEQDVINLVADHYLTQFPADKLSIIRADALTFQPPNKVRYDTVWHDIWPDICADNWESMKLLHRRYGKRAIWQGSWCREEVRRLARRELL